MEGSTYVFKAIHLNERGAADQRKIFGPRIPYGLSQQFVEDLHIQFDHRIPRKGQLRESLFIHWQQFIDTNIESFEWR